MNSFVMHLHHCFCRSLKFDMQLLIVTVIREVTFIFYFFHANFLLEKTEKSQLIVWFQAHSFVTQVTLIFG